MPGVWEGAAVTCTPYTTVQIGRTVITAITAEGGAALHLAEPLALMTLEVACTIVGIARQTARNALWRYPERFDCLTHPYMPNGARVLTPRDLETLKAMFPPRRARLGGPKPHPR